MIAKRLGRFEIIREIGKGAMGSVYLAHDPKIDRKIAIKIISLPEGVSEAEAQESRGRFVREAQAAGKLQHPNIITIYDVVEEGSLSYIAMEYIDGETLEAYARPDSLLPLRRLLTIAEQACSALDYAHRNNVIHRDIKPANLMLVKGEALKITDFGLAKKPGANLTQAGMLVGTPNYMSPEQISGREMDGRGDFFSLAVVLYELLTGERPYGGDTISTIIYRILYEEPRSPRIVNEKLPTAFDQIFKKALAKNPAERFQTGAEFMEALRNYSSYSLKSPVSTSAPTLRAVRETLPRAASSKASKGASSSSAEAAPTPLFAGQPLKIAAFALVAFLAILVFPRQIHQGTDEGTESSREPAAIVQDQAGFLNSPPPEEKSPPAVSSANGFESVIQTVSPGTRFFLDGKQLLENQVNLAEKDDSEHTLVAVDGCMESSLIIRPPLEKKLVLADLKPKIADLHIGSNPEGALVFVNGQSLGDTPATKVSFNACEPTEFVLKKENYRDFLWTSDGTKSWNEISMALANVTLSEIPPGYAKFPSLPSEYTVQIFEGNRELQLEGNLLTLREGDHQLIIRNHGIGLEKKVNVTIEGDKTQPVRLQWPALGKINVLTFPSKVTIYLDGREVGHAPIHDLDLVEGTYRIRAVPDANPSLAVEEEVTIVPGQTAQKRFKFENL